MGRPRIVLPVTADQFFEKACLDQRRPPWTAIGTTELARLLDINPQNLWNWGVRRTGPTPEASPGQVYRIGRAKLTVYRLDRVCEWLDPEGRPLWHWARRFLTEKFVWVPDDDDTDDGPPATVEEVLAAIAYLERGKRPSFWHRQWRWRSAEVGLDALREDYLAPPAADPAPSRAA